MNKERKRNKTVFFSLLASGCFSGGIVLQHVAANAPTVGVFFGTICVLAAAFFRGNIEVKE